MNGMPATRISLSSFLDPLIRNCAYIVLCLVATHAMGQLDSDFSGDGKVTTAPFVLNPGSTMDISDLGLQSFGSIVAVGTCNWMGTPAENTDMIVVRYAPDGTLDPSFAGGDGYHRLDMADGFEQANAVAVQTDDRIVVAGHSWSAGAAGRYLVVQRLLPNGEVDNTFNGIGLRIIDIGGSGQSASDVLVRSNGKIVAVGSTWTTSYNSDFLVVQLNSDGSLDNSFSFDGIQTTSYDPYSSESAGAVVERSDGHLVVAGGSMTDLMLVCYRPDGTLDLSFGQNGKTVITAPSTSFGSGIVTVSGMDTDDSGRTYIAGSVSYTDGMNPTAMQINGFLVRCLPNGDVDPEFPWIVKSDHFISDVQCADDGTILLSGSFVGASSNMDLFRYLPSGHTDQSFGQYGALGIEFDGAYVAASAIHIQPNGRILLGGSSSFQGETRRQFAIARILYEPYIGIVEFPVAENVLYYPNPVADELHFSYTLGGSEVLSCELLDAQGRTVRGFFSNRNRPAGEQCELLDMRGLAAGAYIVRLSNGQGSSGVRIIKP